MSAAHGPLPGPPAAVRQRRILELLDARSYVTCSEIREMFGVSDMTARRDVKALVDKGLARRVYGGAVLPDIPV